MEFCKELKLEQIGKDKGTKHYLGNEKWVLYQTMMDLGSKDNLFTFRCGSYAYSKMIKLFKLADETSKSLCNYCEDVVFNGEQIFILRCFDMDKKELIISNEYPEAYEKEDRQLNKFYIDVRENDIVLYFA